MIENQDSKGPDATADRSTVKKQTSEPATATAGGHRQDSDPKWQKRAAIGTMTAAACNVVALVVFILVSVINSL